MIAVALGAALALASAGQPEPGEVVWALGDGADGSAVSRQMARRIERDDPDAFLYLGDVYPTGTREDFARRFHTAYGRLAPITWPTAGNHEWGNRATGYFPYWRRYGRARSWNRFEIAGWEVISLNSEEPHGEGSRQLRWLRRVLSERDTTCRLAFWHRPRFSAGTLHGDAPDIEPLWRTLRGRARLVLNGHEHVMMRLYRRAGLTEYVAGTGGQVRYGLRSDPRVAFSRSARTGGLRMELSPGTARLEFRDPSGTVLDRSRVTCSRPLTFARAGR